jgi:AraC family ethanolamine operon transcriptional activator
MLFPAGLVIDYDDLNIEEMSELSLAWSLERQQMQKGLFRGTIRGVHTPHIQIGRTQYSHGMLTKGDFPKDCITLTFVHTPPYGSVTYQNETLQNDTFFIAKYGDEIDLLVSSEAIIYAISIDEAYFYQEYESYFNEPLESFVKNGRLRVKEGMHQLLLQHFLMLLNHIEKEEYIDFERVEESVMYNIFNALDIQQKYKQRKKFDAAAIRELLMSHVNADFEDIEINALSQKLSISQRQFFNAFKQKYGLTPKQYLQSIKLNKIRKILLLSDPNETNISDIAFEFGYAHMSHFSKIYKEMFGELPSQTLIHK